MEYLGVIYDLGRLLISILMWIGDELHIVFEL